jgi:hypothetical protein
MPVISSHMSRIIAGLGGANKRLVAALDMTEVATRSQVQLAENPSCGIDKRLDTVLNCTVLQLRLEYSKRETAKNSQVDP